MRWLPYKDPVTTVIDNGSAVIKLFKFLFGWF